MIFLSFVSHINCDSPLFGVQSGMFGILCKLTEVRGDLVYTVATGTVDMSREGIIGLWCGNWISKF